jgi:putative membrane protein
MFVNRSLPLTLILRDAWREQIALMLVAAISTAIYLEYLNPVLGVPGAPAEAISVLGISLSFFIGFLSSHAYERWMQARSAFGRIQRLSRNFSRMVLAYFSDNRSDVERPLIRALQERLVLRQLAIAHALKARLRDDESADDYLAYLNDEDVAGIEGQSHVPNAILLLQAKTLALAAQSNYLDGYRMIAMNEQLNEVTAAIGTCERIKGTPFFPFYRTAVHYLLWAFLIIFPMAIADAAGYWAILYSVILGSILAWLVNAANTYMTPFDNLPSAVPVANIVRNTEIDLLQQLGKKDIPPPLTPIDGRCLP